MKTEKKKVNHLSVFLVKVPYTTTNQIVSTDSCDAPIEVRISGYGSGHLFIKISPDKPPKWASLFQGFLDPESIEVPGVSAVFLIKVNGRHFVLAFGQGGRFLIKDDVCEERFGLLCALNSVDPKSFRCVDVQSLDAIQSHTRIQSGEEATPDQFGLDVEQDMLKAIVGTPLDQRLGNRMTGSDSLSVAVKMDLSDLPYLLNEYRKKFEEDLSAANYEWVNNISIINDAAITTSLEKQLISKFVAQDLGNIWLSIPEIIDWSMVKGFMYSHGRKEIHSDINLGAFLKTIKDGTAVTLEFLRLRRVSCADGEHRQVFKSWSIYKCLYAEIDHDGAKYILNDGKWFSVDTKFVDRTNTDFAKIPHSKLNFPRYKGGGEGSYNTSVADAEPTHYALLDDRKKVMHGGGHGQIEICDLMSIDSELIHVKIYGKSSVLSHLFAQGFVSGQLIQIDSDFREKVRKQLPALFVDLIDVQKKPSQDEFTIVFAVISDVQGENLHLPFFSRVNLNNTAKILRGFGYKVELLKIAVDEDYSKTTKIPPNKKQQGGYAAPA